MSDPDTLDVLAYLARRHANAALVAQRLPAAEPLAADRRRQLEVMIDEITAGLHHGAAASEAHLVAAEAASRAALAADEEII